jgi:predicted permease
MRFIVCGVAIYCALQASSQRKEEWMWVLGGIAVLFNPLIPFHLSRGLWSIVDIIVGITLIISIFFVRGGKAKNTESKSDHR